VPSSCGCAANRLTRCRQARDPGVAFSGGSYRVPGTKFVCLHSGCQAPSSCEYESTAIERAAEVAWRSGAFNSRTIRRLLKNGGSRQETMDFIEEHPVIRSVFEYDVFFRKALAEG
jgi:hypothetical protein